MQKGNILNFLKRPSSSSIDASSEKASKSSDGQTSETADGNLVSVLDDDELVENKTDKLEKISTDIEEVKENQKNILAMIEKGSMPVNDKKSEEKQEKLGGLQHQ